MLTSLPEEVNCSLQRSLIPSPEIESFFFVWTEKRRKRTFKGDLRRPEKKKKTRHVVVGTVSYVLVRLSRTPFLLLLQVGDADRPSCHQMHRSLAAGSLIRSIPVMLRFCTRLPGP